MKAGEVWRVKPWCQNRFINEKYEFVVINKVHEGCVWASWLQMDYSRSPDKFHFMQMIEGFTADFEKWCNSVEQFKMDKEIKLGVEWE